MIGVLVNQLLEFPEEGRTERVLWVDTLGRGVFVIDITSPTALPVFRTASDLDEAMATGSARISPKDPWLMPLAEADVPSEHKVKRDAAWAVIRPIILNQPGIFQVEERARCVRRAMDETGRTKQTIYRWLRRYWQRGMTPNTLLPDYHQSGAPGTDKKAGPVKLGRPSRYAVVGINIDVETRRRISTTITRYFAQNRKMDVTGAFHQFLKKYHTIFVIDEDTGQQKDRIRGPHMSERQFRYWYQKDCDVFQLERVRRTPRVYDKDLRALLNSSAGEVFGPGSRYQIDATIADVYLLSRSDRTRIVGRPVLYIVIDVFSRLIVGIYVGFEGPSWVGAMMALANTASDKVTYCREFGIKITESEWPARHLPYILLGDRGEMLSQHVEMLAALFDVQIENTAPYRADWKGIVEQRFRLLPAKFKAYVPGYIEVDYQERGGDDYRLDATLDIEEFTAVIIQCVRYYNTCHVLKDYALHPQMIADGVAPIPVELWEWGVARRCGTLKSFPEDTVKLSLLPSAQATVTESGIRFAGCFYSCQKAMEEHWFERARQRGTWKVDISYEPRLMDTIYLRDGTGRHIRFIACALTPKSRQHEGRTVWEIDQIGQAAKTIMASRAPENLQGQIDLDTSVKAIVDKAAAKKAATAPKGESKRARTSGIRENRSAERRENQKREAFRVDQPVAPPADGRKVVPFPTAPPPDDYSMPDITEILSSFEGEGVDDDAER